MMPLLLNYLRMSKGESFFMAANEPHAYLKGNILEVKKLGVYQWKQAAKLFFLPFTGGKL